MRAGIRASRGARREHGDERKPGAAAAAAVLGVRSLLPTDYVAQRPFEWTPKGARAAPDYAPIRGWMGKGRALRTGAQLRTAVLRLDAGEPAKVVGDAFEDVEGWIDILIEGEGSRVEARMKKK